MQALPDELLSALARRESTSAAALVHAVSIATKPASTAQPPALWTGGSKRELVRLLGGALPPGPFARSARGDRSCLRLLFVSVRDDCDRARAGRRHHKRTGKPA